MDLTANPDVVITFTVTQYQSVTQGTMLTSGASPQVTTALVQDSTARVTRLNNGAFEVSGGGPQGNPLVVLLEVLPADAYAVAGVIIRNLNSVNEGGTAWDQVIVGSGSNDNRVTLRDVARKPTSVAAIDYELLLLVKPKQFSADFPIGDFGLIDPLWTNR